MTVVFVVLATAALRCTGGASCGSSPEASRSSSYFQRSPPSPRIPRKYSAPRPTWRNGSRCIEQTLRDALYDAQHCYAHAWQAGDLVVADNYTLLHGREPYARKCGRHLRRVHVLGDPPLMNPALR
jgi:hypothetical protein